MGGFSCADAPAPPRAPETPTMAASICKDRVITISVACWLPPSFRVLLALLLSGKRDRVARVHPAPAHGLVDVDKLRVSIGQRVHRLELGVEQLALGVEHVDVARRAVI